jgi:hypothetical protein
MKAVPIYSSISFSVPRMHNKANTDDNSGAKVLRKTASTLVSYCLISGYMNEYALEDDRALGKGPYTTS